MTSGIVLNDYYGMDWKTIHTGKVSLTPLPYDKLWEHIQENVMIIMVEL